MSVAETMEVRTSAESEKVLETKTDTYIFRSNHEATTILIIAI